MSYNIILNNFTENDFVSKGAKANIKKFIKKNVSINEIDSINNLKNEIIAKYLKINKKLFRPAEVELLIADSSKITKKTGWKAKVKIDKLIEKMVINDLKFLEKNY